MKIILKEQQLLTIIEQNTDANYLKWKRKNITIRGIKEVGEENNAGAMLGKGLYTAFLSNRDLAKQYGNVYFVLNAIPTKPKIFNTLNEWEIWFYNTLVYKFSKENGKDFPDKRDFNSKTTIEDEMKKLGYNGIIIKGREMVNFEPENVKYFKNEISLKDYYFSNILNESINNDKIYYHGRTKSRPYDNTYIYITDSFEYATSYSDGKEVFKYNIPFDMNKIFTLKNKKHLMTLKNNIDEYSYKQILNESDGEMDWSSLNYIMNNEYDEPEELLQSLGFLGVKLRERPKIESIYVFDESNLKFVGKIDITTPENIEKIKQYHQSFEKDYINESEEKKLKSLLNRIKYVRGLSDELKEFGKNHLKSYSYIGKGRISGLNLDKSLEEKLKNEKLPNGFDMGVDKDGYYIHTHRSRSKSYESPLKIPIKDIKFIDSTG